MMVHVPSRVEIIRTLDRDDDWACHDCAEAEQDDEEEEENDDEEGEDE